MRGSYQTLLDRVDALCAQLAERYRRHLVCRAGCSECCRHHPSVFAVEADAIREAVLQLPEEIRHRLRAQVCLLQEEEAANAQTACPLLLDDRCAVYQSRPVICRTQGLPLLVEAEDGRLEVDFCPLNFSGPDACGDLDENFLVPLEQLNRGLVLANREFCRRSGVDDDGARRRIGDLAV